MPVSLAISVMLALPIIDYFKGDFPLILLSYLNAYQCKFFGNISRNSFSPFYPTVVSAVKILLHTQIQRLLLVIYTVKIKVINGFSMHIIVFIDDRESGAGHHLLYLKLLGYLFD